MNEVIRVKEVIIEKEVISCDVSPVAMFKQVMCLFYRFAVQPTFERHHILSAPSYIICFFISSVDFGSDL